jgi:hypothetical protein
MEIREALSQIETIRAQVTRTGVFRGYRAATVGSTGLLALAAAALQTTLVPQPEQNVAGYLELWIAVAAVSVTVVAIELTVRILRTDSLLARQQTLRAVEQFLPCVIAGAALTFALFHFAPDSLHLLPGLWSIVFSLGVLASSRQLPRAVHLVGMHYLVAGIACIAWARGDYALSPWAMASTFGAGQLLSAAVLFCTLERHHARS